MKQRLLVFLLIFVMLSGYGCKSSKENAPAATSDQPTTTTSSQSQEATPDRPTTAPVTEPTTEATEPTTTVPPTTEATEPVTEPIEPTEPAPTEPTKPVEAPKPTTPTKPAQTTKPAKPAKPSQTTKPTEPTEPSEPVIPTEPTEPTETVNPTEPTPPEEETVDIGWVNVDGKTYYYHADGSAHTGWLSLDDDRYYFFEDGTMAIGKVKVPGSGTRYFTSKGKECILVNPWNYVPDDYSPKLSKYKDYKVASICLEDLKDMIADCKSAGKKAVVVSAYRSHSYQQGLYERRIQRFLDQGYDYETAVIEAGKRVAVPGTSEHELGLAVDIVDVNYQNLDSKQEETAAQKWLMANSWKYGFILRYPNEKSGVTGIIYEPWHYRYVGKELAKELHETGLCLEEYFASLT